MGELVLIDDRADPRVGGGGDATVDDAQRFGGEIVGHVEEVRELRGLARGVLEGWQWVAGCGADASPFFRVFNPERQRVRFDPDLVGWLMEKYAELGVKLHTDTTVVRIEQVDGAFRVTAGGESGSTTFDADLVVHAAGRKPDLASLDLEAGNVELRDGQIALTEHLQSVSNPAVYAAGDTSQMGPPLTPVSNHDGKIVAANLLDGNHRTPNYKGVPSVAFTLPPIASVGLGEAEARAKGFDFRDPAEK